MKKIFTFLAYICLILIGCTTFTYAGEKESYEKDGYIFQNENSDELEETSHITQDLVITGVRATSTGPFSAIVTIDTAVLAKVRVIYWATNAGIETSQVEKSNVFRVTNEIILSDLTSDTFYSYYVITKDRQGNTVTSGIQSFLTESVGGGHNNL